MLPQQVKPCKSAKIAHKVYQWAYEVEGQEGTQGNHPETGEPLPIVAVKCPHCHVACGFSDYGENTHTCGAFLRIVKTLTPG